LDGANLELEQRFRRGLLPISFQIRAELQLSTSYHVVELFKLATQNIIVMKSAPAPQKKGPAPKVKGCTEDGRGRALFQS
jgi:hypothetical protein